MPAAVAGPLIGAAISGGTALVGAKMASNASKNAAQTQERAANQAVQNSQQATRDALAYLDRSRSSGMPQQGGATSYLGNLLGIPGAGSQTPKGPLPSMPAMPQGSGEYMRLFGSAPGMQYAGSGQSPMAAARSGGLVMLQAPDGRRKAVPAEQVDHFVRLGATRVN